MEFPATSLALLLAKNNKVFGLWHCRNVLNLSLFYRYYFGRVHRNQPNWFHFLILDEGLLVFLIDCKIFLSLFLDVARMYMSIVSFLAQLGSGILCL